MAKTLGIILKEAAARQVELLEERPYLSMQLYLGDEGLVVDMEARNFTDRHAYCTVVPWDLLTTDGAILTAIDTGVDTVCTDPLVEPPLLPGQDQQAQSGAEPPLTLEEIAAEEAVQQEAEQIAQEPDGPVVPGDTDEDAAPTGSDPAPTSSDPE